MSQEFLKTINLKEKTINWFARKQFRGGGKGTLWPSEASAKFINEYGEEQVIGKCARAVYYRVKGVEETNPPTAMNQVLFLLGNQVESAITEAWKQMGIWENNSVKWMNRDKNISGEYDVILREGDMLYGVECKSFYGYYANKQLLGHWSGRGKAKYFVEGKPKDEHLMQAALYCDNTRGQLAGFKLFYISRDQCDMGEFNITVNEEGKIFINGREENRFTMQNIYDRYETLNHAIKNNLKPSRDFIMYPSEERVETLYARGDLSKTVYEASKKKTNPVKVRDWHCGYCNFRDYCTRDTDDTVQEEETIAPDALVHGSL